MRRLSLLFAAVLLASLWLGGSGIEGAASGTPAYTLTDLQQFGISSAGVAINDATQIADRRLNSLTAIAQPIYQHAHGPGR